LSKFFKSDSPIKKVFIFTFLLSILSMADKKKNAPLPASSAGLLRFFEDETKGVKIDPKIIISMPISIIVVSWAIELLLAP